MNRLELQSKIIEEGKKRKITITEIRIYDRGNDGLDFYPEIQNNIAKKWVYKHQVEELINDLAPIERPHTIKEIGLDKSRYNLFSVGDEIEAENLWIRLAAGEDEPKDLIKVGTCCGQYRSGWIKGIVFETPKQNDRALGVKFSRDIFIEDKDLGWIGCVENLEKYIKEGKIKKVEKGQPLWSGTHIWTIRKP